MCGIVGTLGLGPADPGVVERMATAIRHRGPTSCGRFFDGAVGLAMNRLAIIDLAGGDQPMTSPQHGLTIVFNGEIYNYRELRAEFAGRYDFRTHSDTEVILAGYALLGTEIFTRLNGMFGVAIWDATRRHLVLARDPLGIKPLYVLENDQGLFFSSEIKSFTETKLANTVNPAAIRDYLAAGYVFQPHTAVAGVWQVEPGHFHIIDASLHRMESAFFYRPSGAPIGRGDRLLPDLAARVDEAVVRQTVADVPYGLLLSAGMDSMAILASLRARGLAENITTFTAGFDHQSFSEHDAVRDVTDAWGMRNVQTILDAGAVGRLLPQLFRTFDNLEFLPTCVAIHAVAQQAAAEVRLVLAGNGGDELFLGYPTYRATAVVDRLGPARKLLRGLRWASDLVSASDGYLSLGEKIARFIHVADQEPLLAHAQWRRIFDAEDIGPLTRSTAADSAELYASQLRHFSTDLDIPLLERLSAGDIKTWLVDCSLSMWDKAGMASSLEIRVPLLDLDLVAAVKAVPAAMRAGKIGTKSVFRDAMRDRLPPSVLQKSKQGFQVPVAHWLRGPLRDTFRDLVFSLPEQRFDHRRLDRLWRDFESGGSGEALKIWILGCLAGWVDAHGMRFS
jgi:asparagine synthase (glutamine-hydrolysing)